jgi:hypothetical protein
MVTYHYVKIYVSIIIQLEVININVRNFKFPIGFNSNPHPIWTPKNMALTPYTKWCPELIPDIEKFLPAAIFKMATTIPQKFNIVRYHQNLICG